MSEDGRDAIGAANTSREKFWANLRGRESEVRTFTRPHAALRGWWIGLVADSALHFHLHVTAG